MICADVPFVGGSTQTVLWKLIELIPKEVREMRHTHTCSCNVWTKDNQLLTRVVTSFLLLGEPSFIPAVIMCASNSVDL